MTFASEIKHMRQLLAESMFDFAKRLGVTLGAVVNYEHGRVPELFVLIRLMNLACELQQREIMNKLLRGIEGRVGKEALRAFVFHSQAALLSETPLRRDHLVRMYEIPPQVGSHSC